MRNRIRNLPMMTLLLAFSLAMLGGGRAHAAPFDQAFIDAMIPHHQSGVMMAQMAVQKAQLTEVRTLARKIINAQRKEIQQMQAWRKAWYGSAAAPGKMHGGNHMMHGKMLNGPMMRGSMMGLPMKMEMDMGKLRNAKGREFDKMFLQMMIPHHAGAIMMAHEALNVTGRREIRSVSHQIIASQAREIGQMQNILDRRF